MVRFSTASAIQAADRECQDCLELTVSEREVIISVADGAGGIAGGLVAATLAVRSTIERATFSDADSVASYLESVDRLLERDPEAGESTLVVAVVRAEGLFGGSVGDSCAWLVAEDKFLDLTARQRRKPLLGTGSAVPVGFEATASSGTLIVATDGLFKYAPADRICAIARGPDLQAAAANLIDAVRLKSGALQDDVAVALCRW